MSPRVVSSFDATSGDPAPDGGDVRDVDRFPKATRLLMIRLSSFGDIVQATPVARAFRQRFSNAQVDWLVREDFASLLKGHPEIERLQVFERKRGISGLIRLAWSLGSEPYTHLYDAHNNLRSHLFCVVFRIRHRLRHPGLTFIRRSKERWKRWLLFRWRINRFPKPYRGAESFLRPLSDWGLNLHPAGPQFFASTALPDTIQEELAKLPRPWVALAPSAAWPMKRWPVEHWQALAMKLEASLLLLGGRDDHFIREIRAPRSVNLAGRLSLMESAAVLAASDLVISGDTGLLHVADLMEKPTLALIGPTAFGYPSRPSSRVLEIDLACKPCSKDGRGRCQNSVYQRCLVELSPEMVAQAAKEALARIPERPLS